MTGIIGRTGRESLVACLESSLHNLQVLRGLVGRGAELVILRHCDLRRWGGKKHPAS